MELELFEKWLNAINRPNTVRVKMSLFRSRILPYCKDDLRTLITDKWAGLHPRTIKSLIYIYKDYISFKTGQNIDIKKYTRYLLKNFSNYLKILLIHSMIANLLQGFP